MSTQAIAPGFPSTQRLGCASRELGAVPLFPSECARRPSLPSRWATAVYQFPIFVGSLLIVMIWFVVQLDSSVADHARCSALVVCDESCERGTVGKALCPIDPEVLRVLGQ